MSQRIEFEISRQPAALELSRREWTPGPGVGPAGVWIAAVVRDAAGHDYWGVRGCDDYITGMTHVVSPFCGFRTLRKGLDATPSHLFAEYSTIDWYEPFDYVNDSERLQLLYSSGRIMRDGNGFDWSDASDRWQLHSNPVSDVVVVHVPQQPGVAEQFYYRHQLMHSVGTVDGIEVSGYTHQDYAYGPPGTTYTDLPIVRTLQGLWVSWLQEYPDGQVGGGHFWQGREGLQFGPGYQLKNGATTVHDDVVAVPGFDGDGNIVSMDVTMGADCYSFVFDTKGSPYHVFGHLVSDPSGRRPARSWCWVEYESGLMTPEIFDLMMKPFRLVRGL